MDNPAAVVKGAMTPGSVAEPPIAAVGVVYRRDQIRVGKVPMSTKIFQGIGALPGSHKDFAFNTFLLLYYSQILGVPASSASIVLAIALVVDAITDPIVGAYSDNFRSRLGRRHPFMYASALPLGVFMYLLFSPPAGASEISLLGWMLTFTLLVRLVFTFFVVPWNAVAAEYSQNYVERTSIITYRYLVGWVGGVTFAFVMYTFVFAGSPAYPAGQLDPANYPLFALVLGCLIPLWCLVTTHLTRREVPYLLQPVSATPKFDFRELVSQVVMALGSPNFRLLFIAMLLFAGIAGVGGVFDIYMNTYFWEFKPQDLRWFGATIIGALTAFIAVPLLQERFQKQNILVTVLAFSMALGMLKVILRFADIWPDNGNPMLLVALIVHGCVVVFLLTTAGIMFGSMIADLVDEQALRVQRRQEGVFSSVIGFSSKATSSIGLIAGGFLLDFVVSFPRGTQPGEVGADTLFRLAFTDGIAIHVFYAIPIYLTSRYTLTRERLKEIQAQLADA
ncbi:MAG: MFS transporter [Gammaproteobacteria bacterium]|nr:MFS transporter [Gammaproteobacteria bacterium]